MNKADDSELPRRRFLRHVLVLGGVTGAGALLAGGVQAQTAAQTQGDAPGTTTRKGYRLTEHIRTYYEKAQI